MSVYGGEAELDDGRGRVRLAAGERTFARWGAQAEEPRRFEPGEENDDFTQWDGLRESEERSAARSSEYLPDELDAYAGEFERNGQWQYESTVGYVWVPRVEFGWQPYSNGQLGVDALRLHVGPLRALGLGPLPLRPLGAAGVLRLGLGARPHLGPGLGELGGGAATPARRPWAGAISRSGPGVSHNGSRDVARPLRADPWNVVRRGDLGGRNVSQRRVGIDRIEPGALRAADSVALRPTRDARSLRSGDDAPRAISRRQTPGDFVRELEVDNKTTIPAPWTHGYGPPPAESTERATARRAERTRRTTRTPGPNAPTSASGSRSDGSAAAPRQSQRPTPWYARRSTGSPSGEGGTAARPAPSAGAETGRSGSAWGTRSRRGIEGPRGGCGAH